MWIRTQNKQRIINSIVDETVNYIKKIRALKVQRDKFFTELDSIDNKMEVGENVDQNAE